MPLTVILESLDGQLVASFPESTTDRVTGSLKAVDWDRFKDQWNHLRHIHFPVPSKKPVVDILIGLDYSDLHTSLEEVVGKIGEPTARLTPLGWTCVGYPTSSKSISQARSFFCKQDGSCLNDINNSLRKFWEVENIGLSETETMMSVDEKHAVQLVNNNLKYINNQYEVCIPWKDEIQNIENNYGMAMKRLVCTERKLDKEPLAAEEYGNIIKEYLKKGYIRKIPASEKEADRNWYLPHFAVFRPDKVTTKTRIVFDGSAKYKNQSLNENIHQGPKLQRDLFLVLLRFRRFPVALVSDISEMYLQIKVKPTDRSFLSFLWRDMDSTRVPDKYEFDRLVFGLNSSPFEAQFVVSNHAIKHSDHLPLLAESVLESTYMDDTMDSVPDDDTGRELYKQLTTLWKSCNMHAHKWLSNSCKVLEGIPEEDCASKIRIYEEELPSTKTLGMVWLADKDLLSYRNIKIDKDLTCTKRNFLKILASVFDPLGLVSPYIIQAKILMQSLWEAGLDWDTKIESDLEQEINTWIDQLKDLERISVPRSICLSQEEKERDVELHGFSDASERDLFK